MTIRTQPRSTGSAAPFCAPLQVFANQEDFEAHNNMPYVKAWFARLPPYDAVRFSQNSMVKAEVGKVEAPPSMAGPVG